MDTNVPSGGTSNGFGGSGTSGSNAGGTGTAGTGTAGRGAGGSISGGGAAGGSVSVGGAAGGSISTGGAAGGSISTGGAGRSSAGGKAGSGSGGTPASGGSAGSGPGTCDTDSCPAKSGVTAQCKRRFMLGANYAWHDTHFGADFGGIPQWSQPGVSGKANTVLQELQRMSQKGLSVIRWWVWPELRGPGVTLDGSGTPTGLGGTALADVARALELAEQADVYLMLTLFSFDNFRPTRTTNNLSVRGMQPIVVDTARSAALVNTVVWPFAAAVEQSPFRHRMIAWDVMNEPEWAVSGAGVGGDEAFDPTAGLQTVSHAQMHRFLDAVIGGLRASSSAMVTIGAAAYKWKSAWLDLDQDFYQFHMYDWVHESWPYNRTPQSYGLGDKPVVYGEFPWEGIGNQGLRSFLDGALSSGYAGALAWQFNENENDLTALKAFADANPCVTRY
jgi:hypothetical protein